MKAACILFSVLALAYSAPADEVGSCVQSASSTADAQVVESINKKCDGNADLLSCHKDAWNMHIDGNQLYLQYLDQANIALAACPQAENEHACANEALHQLESYFQQMQAEELVKALGNPFEKCQGETGYSTCILGQFESLRDAKEGSMAAVNAVLQKLNHC